MASLRWFSCVLVVSGALTVVGCAASGTVYVDDPTPTSAADRALNLDFEDRVIPVGGVVPAVDHNGSASVRVEVLTRNGGRILRAAGREVGNAVRLPQFSGTAVSPLAQLAVYSAGPEDILNPDTSDFAFGADVMVDAEAGSTEYDNGNNIMQRGLFEEESQFKLQVDSGRPSCRVAGSEGEAMVKSETEVEPNEWYRLTCERDDETVRLTVQHIGAATVDEDTTEMEVVTGPVSFARSIPLTVGGKSGTSGQVVTTDTDQFNGTLDNIWYSRK